MHDYEPKEPLQSDMAKMQLVCDAILLLKKQLDTQQNALDETQDQINVLERSVLPNLLQTMGMKSVHTESGVKADLVVRVHASLPTNPVRRHVALEAIRNSGNAGLIKSEFKIQYGLNAAASINVFKGLLTEYKIKDVAAIIHRETIHHKTYEKFVRDLAKESPELDLSDYGGYRQTIAIVKVQ